MVADDVIHISIRVDSLEDLLNMPDDFIERVANFVVDNNLAPQFCDPDPYPHPKLEEK